jgi:hypothetical protein
VGALIGLALADAAGADPGLAIALCVTAFADGNAAEHLPLGRAVEPLRNARRAGRER